MFSEIILSIGLGICLGIFTGLIPGVHINLLSVILLGFYSVIAKFLSPFGFCCLLVSMAMAHLFLGFIPAVFLGAPNSENAMGVLPGHALLMRGRGLRAVMLLCISCLSSLILGFLLLPFLIFLIPAVYNYVKNAIGWILLAIMVSMVWRERGVRNKIWALILLLLSGILGVLAFDINIKNVLLPMLSGLFGVGMLFVSSFRNIRIPEQENDLSDFSENTTYGKELKGCEEKEKSAGVSIIISGIISGVLNFLCKIKKNIRVILVSLFSGTLVCIFPAIGPSQAAIIGSEFIDKTDENYLLLVGGISSINMLVSIITLYTIGKARNGVIVALGEIIKPDYKHVFLFGFVAVLAAAVVLILTIFLAKRFCKFISKINYRAFSFAIILFISAMVLIFSGFLGLLVLAISSAISIIPNITGVGRNNAMGCLLLPVIIMYLL